MDLNPRSLQDSLTKLRELRYHRYEECAPIVRDWFKLRRRIDAHSQHQDLWRVHDWLVSPYTLQALDFAGLAKHIVDTLRAGNEFDSDLIFLLTLIDEAPSFAKVTRMIAHEHVVAEGAYDGLSKQPKRYTELEKIMQADPLLLRFWDRINSRYASHIKTNPRGVIRRTLARERGFDSRHPFKWTKKRDRLQITFDALCHRWCLYGFEKGKPLALKLTVNSTSHGTMIFVPRGMSLAANGTFEWRAITSIHKAHGASRQGEKLFEVRMQHRQNVERAKNLAKEAGRLRLRGEEFSTYILSSMKQLPNRKRWLKRLLYNS